MEARPPPPKHYIPIYRDSSNIGAVSGGGEVSGSMVVQDMVVVGRIGLGEIVGGVDGGGGGGR